MSWQIIGYRKMESHYEQVVYVCMYEWSRDRKKNVTSPWGDNLLENEKCRVTVIMLYRCTCVVEEKERKKKAESAW